MKKTILWIIIIVVLVLVIFLISSGAKNEQGLEKSVKIGALLPLTGKFASLGEDIKNGLELAKEDIVKKKGINFDIVYEDSAADPKIALSGATKLIDLDKVGVVIAGPGSSANLAVAPKMEETKTVFIAISSTPKLNDSGEYILKVLHDIDIDAVKIAEYANQNSLKKAAVLYDSSSDTMITAQVAFENKFKTLGGQVVASEAYDSKTVTDFRTILTKAKAKNPDLVVVFAIEKIMGQVVKQAREVGIKQQVFGYSAIDSEEFFIGAGDAAEGVVIPALVFSCATPNTNEIKSYCDAYKEKFDDKRGVAYGAYAYDVLHLIASTFSSTDGEGTIDKEKIIKTISATKNYPGASGSLSFDKNGNVENVQFEFRKVVDGQFVRVEN